MRHSDRNVGKNFGKSKLWKRQKNLCCPSASSEFQEGVNQFMKIDCMKEKQCYLKK